MTPKPMLTYSVRPQETKQDWPETIIQFGEGNFIRAYFDWMIDTLNRKQLHQGKIVSVQPTPRGNVVPVLNKQDGLFTVVERGILNGTQIDQPTIVSSIKRGINPYEDWKAVLTVAESPDIKVIVSNTTEAGLVYSPEDFNDKKSPLSFPGKVTAFLYHRYKHFKGSKEAGVFLLPLELLENNGLLLESYVKQTATDWALPTLFLEWISNANVFCNTLVDRIVSGSPKDPNLFSLAYDDQLLTVCEPYHFFAVNGRKSIESVLPFQKAGLNVTYANVSDFRELKVRILNGAHTAMAAPAFLLGCSTVKEAMDSHLIRDYVWETLNEEILPTINQSQARKEQFLQKTIERFDNPFIEHQLTSIALQSLFKWKTRVWPSVLNHEDSPPERLALSLAALLVFFRTSEQDTDGNWSILRGGERHPIRENESTLAELYKQWNSLKPIHAIFTDLLDSESLFGERLPYSPHFQSLVTQYGETIVKEGLEHVLSTYNWHKQ